MAFADLTGDVSKLTPGDFNTMDSTVEGGLQPGDTEVSKVIDRAREHHGQATARAT